MGIQTDIDVPNGRIIHHVSGELTLEDVMDAISSLFSHPDFDAAMNILVLLEPESTLALSTEDIDIMAQALRNSPVRQGSGKSAIVARNSADFGTARMLQAMLEFENREVSVFYEQETAEAWLQADQG